METTEKTVVSLNKPTPAWATTVFRVIFILTGVAAFIIVGSTMFDNDMKVEIVLWLKGVDMAVWAITRFLGVEVTRDFSVPDK